MPARKRLSWGGAPRLCEERPQFEIEGDVVCHHHDCEAIDKVGKSASRNGWTLGGSGNRPNALRQYRMFGDMPLCAGVATTGKKRLLVREMGQDRRGRILDQGEATRVFFSGVGLSHPPQHLIQTPVIGVDGTDADAVSGDPCGIDDQLERLVDHDAPLSTLPT